MPFGLLDGVETTVLVKFVSGVEAQNGNELTPTQVKDQPTQMEWPVEPSAYYTVCLTHPLELEGQYREFLHWLVVNISGNDIASGQVLAEYLGSGPVKRIGIQPYVFLVYRQTGKIDPDEAPISNRSTIGRWGEIRIKKFAAKYQLGQPVAGNYILSQYDDYVPKLHKQVGFNPDTLMENYK